MGVAKAARRTTNIGAMAINALVLIWTWGDWHRFAIALGLSVVILPLNLLVDRLVAKHGASTEIGRALMNQAICAVAFQWIGWPLPVWLWLPFMPLAFDSIASRQSLVVLAISCGVQDVAAIVGGVSPEIPIVFTALAVMSWVLVNARVQIIREMLVTADERGDELARLSVLVEARTRQMRLVFDQVDQGLLVVDLDGTIATEHSAIVERWLGPMPESQRIVDLIRAFAPGRADWFAMAWEALGDGLVPLELAVTQLPARFEVDGRHLAWSYKPFDRRVLVVISDVTDAIANADDERREREMTSLLSRAVRDQASFVESFDEMARLVAAAAVGGDSVSYRRDVHTLKGVAGIVELASIADACHELETAMADVDHVRARELRAVIQARWHELAGFAEPFLEHARSRLDVTESDVVELEAKLARGAPLAELARTLAGWRDDRILARLRQLADLAHSLARQLGKEPLEIEIDCASELRSPNRFAPIWAALCHVVRNAVDHGIESSDARAATGKPAVARLTLRAAARDSAVVIDVSDDGRGIDWDRVKAAAVARGLPASTHGELEAALFDDGVSTSPQVSETSGRGVGLAAMRATAAQLGAVVSATSRAGRGTSIAVALPIDTVQRRRTLAG